MSIHTTAAATKTVEIEGDKWDSASAGAGPGAGTGTGVKLNCVSEETADACH